jgi:alpha-L-rhamnosidase
MNADQERPGYRHIIFRPQPADDISFASYSNLTPYGNAAINWKKENGIFLVNITVPVGSSATVYIPASKADEVMENGEKIEQSSDIAFLRMEEEYAVVNVSSGNYKFKSTLP